MVKIKENIENIRDSVRNYSAHNESNGHSRTAKQNTDKSLDLAVDLAVSKTGEWTLSKLKHKGKEEWRGQSHMETIKKYNTC